MFHGSIEVRVTIPRLAGRQPVMLPTDPAVGSTAALACRPYPVSPSDSTAAAQRRLLRLPPAVRQQQLRHHPPAPQHPARQQWIRWQQRQLQAWPPQQARFSTCLQRRRHRQLQTRRRTQGKSGGGGSRRSSRICSSATWRCGHNKRPWSSAACRLRHALWKCLQLAVLATTRGHFGDHADFSCCGANMNSCRMRFIVLAAAAASAGGAGEAAADGGRAGGHVGRRAGGPRRVFPHAVRLHSLRQPPGAALSWRCCTEEHMHRESQAAPQCTPNILHIFLWQGQ